MTSVNVPEDQSHIPNATDESADALGPHNVDAHMPPQPAGQQTAPQDPVYATPQWNPETNEWAPSNEQHSTWGVAEPGHGDVEDANPVSESYGHAPSGTIPDRRLNLIDSVRDVRGPTPAPTVHYTHDVRTTEAGAESVRFHQEFVQGTAPPTPILQQNPNRKRALIRISSGVTNSQNNNLTATGVPATVTVPTGQTWTLQSVSFLFTASAAVANRNIRLTIRDALGRILYQFVDATATTANQVVQCTFAPGLATQHIGAGPFQLTSALPNLVLPAGSTVTADAVAEDAGDTITVGTVMFSVTGAGVYLMPLRDGGNATASQQGWQLNPGDAPIEIKSEAGIEAVAEAGGGATLFVYEELLSPGGVPGVST